MSVRPILALVLLAALGGVACNNEPAGPAPRTEAPKTESDRESTTLYVVDAVDAQTAYALGTNDEDFTGSIVLKTTDGGQTWSAVLRVSRSEITGLDFVDAQNGVAITDGGALFVTADGGQTWQTKSDATLFERRFEAPAPALGAPAPTVQPGPVELDGVFFAGALDGWAFGNRDERRAGANANRIEMVTRPVVFHTTDGGATWKEQTVAGNVPDMPFRRGFFTDAKTGIAIGGDIDEAPGGVVARTTDGGATWTVVTPDVKQVPTDVYFVDANRGWIVGATEDASGDPGPSDILTTADGGQTWQVQTRVPSSLRSIRFVDPQNGWAVGSGGRVFRTTDGGTTWTEQKEHTWSSGAALEIEDPDFPEDQDAPTFMGLMMMTPTRGWAISDVGVYEYRAK